MLKAEQETIFRWDGDERVVWISSCHPSVWRRLERARFKPTRSYTMNGREIARRYRIPLDCFRYRFLREDRPRRPAPKTAFKAKSPVKMSGQKT